MFSLWHVQGAVALDEWSRLAGDDSGDYDPEDDPDFQASINEVSTALRL